MAQNTQTQPLDVVLIGSGIMSATLGVILNKLQPDWNVAVFERLDAIGLESSDAWNNAGTGHAAFCELNYTQELEDGTIDCSKAFKIDEQFEVSKQFWAYLVENNLISNPSNFINNIPHHIAQFFIICKAFTVRRYHFFNFILPIRAIYFIWKTFFQNIQHG